MFELFRFIPNQIILFNSFFIGTLVFLLIYNYYLFPKFLKIKTKDNQRFLILESWKGLHLSFNLVIILLFQIQNTVRQFGIHWIPWWALLLISGLISGFTILTYAYCFVIPKQVKENFIREFPQFVTSRVSS